MKVGVGDTVILTFLLAEEEFFETKFPPISDTCSAILGVFRHCLCITLSGIDHEFWIIKEYKVSEFWTKMRVSVPYTILSHIGFSTKSHDLMVSKNKSWLVMYDFKEESGRNLQIHGIPDEVGNCVGVYVEGLFPLIDQAREGRESTQRR